MRKKADFNEKKFKFGIISKKFIQLGSTLLNLPIAMGICKSAQMGCKYLIKQAGSYMLPYLGSIFGHKKIEN